MTAPIDYTAVLADLEARRADTAAKLGQIDAAIAVVRAMLGIEANDGASATQSAGQNGEGGTIITSVPTLRGASASIQSDSFFKLSTAQAIRKYLSMMKRPQKPPAIAEALRAGGQVHAIDEKTAYTNVATALRRGVDKEFVKTRNGEWGLAEWYGNKPKGEGE